MKVNCFAFDVLVAKSHFITFWNIKKRFNGRTTFLNLQKNVKEIVVIIVVFSLS